MKAGREIARILPSLNLTAAGAAAAAV